MPRRDSKQPTPLPMPTFGTPADGRKCTKCGQWFHRSHFWRSSTRSYVQRCSLCTPRQPSRRLPNTGNTGKAAPVVPKPKRFIKSVVRVEPVVTSPQQGTSSDSLLSTSFTTPPNETSAT